MNRPNSDSIAQNSKHGTGQGERPLRPTTSPASGEQRAAAGYWGQYRVAASLVLRALRHDRLRWVRLTDPEAGRVDDLQIGSEARVDAVQVKWVGYPRAVSFRDLSTPLAGKPSLIEQLADGWQRLRRIHPTSRVVVHLVTNEQPSAADVLPTGDPPPSPRHFAAFLDQAWRPAQVPDAEPSRSVPVAWRKTWDELVRASGLEPSEFDEFARDCSFDLGYRLSSDAGSEEYDRESAAASSDLKVLA